MEAFKIEQERFAKHSDQSKIIDEVQKAIDDLIEARDTISQGGATSGPVLARLQSSVKESFDKIGGQLSDEISSAQRKYKKALDKQFKATALETTGYDALASNPTLINRAIAMHLLREGQFSVASDFLAETTAKPPNPFPTPGSPNPREYPHADVNLGSISPESLQDHFTEMYLILDDMKKKSNLFPAIHWAKTHRQELERRGSNLEFELNKLQYIWLFRRRSVDDDQAGVIRRISNALSYAQENFKHFQERHQREIQQLAAGIAFMDHLDESPYSHVFDDSNLRDEVASSFTREFCSLLGLSSDSPLYISATAGAIALPQLLKVASIMKAKRTEWTSQDELPVEIPLPPSYQFHSIFVCPVSKEQSTEENPPMMMPCGHVLAAESLNKLGKGSKFKCPYCPKESHPRDAKRVYL